jgi:subtilisin-like proprotein convertase family protein
MLHPIASGMTRLFLLLALAALLLPGCTSRRGGGGGGGDDDDDSVSSGDDDDLFNPDDDDVVTDDDDVVTDDDDVVTDDDDVVTDDDDVVTDDDDTTPEDDDDTTPVDDDDTTPVDDDDTTPVDDDDTAPVDDDDTTPPTGGCSPTGFLSCLSPTVSGSTTSGLATDDVDSWACPAGSMTGPEIGYWFTAPEAGDYAIVLSGMTVDLDLIVLEGTACSSSAACADYAGTAGVETATFTASAGDEFVVVVDGYNGAQGSFSLAVQCPDGGGDDDDATGSDVAVIFGTALPTPIPAGAPTSSSGSTVSTSNTAPSGTIVDVEVAIDLTHTFMGDLTIELTSPQGTTVVLSQNRGSSGANMQGTTFSDSASTPIASGAAPFAGSFQPESPLSAFAGENAAGVWQLDIVDGAAGDYGSLQDWSVTIWTL